MRTNYLPQPINTSGIDLPGALSYLVERLAEHTHDIWAEGRIGNGWKWGPERCDEKLLHPCLVPYSTLPEGEKDYDRRAVLGTVKAILALGYTIGAVSNHKNTAPLIL